MDDYSSCCRLCLSSQEDNLNLFGPECVKELVPQKILCILSILVHPQDTLPQQICLSCADLVKRFYKFSRTASRSQEHLLTVLVKDDDVDKVLYSKCQKNFWNKNYLHLTGGSNYEKLIQEKFNEVKASVDDVTSRFSNVSDTVPQLPLINYLPSVHIPNNDKGATASTSNVSSDKAALNLSQCTISKKAKSLTSKEIIENKFPSEISKSALPKVFSKRQANKKDISPKATKNTGNGSKKTSIIPPSNSTNDSEIKTKITLFRCKYCPCVYSTQEDLFNHDVSEHSAMVSVNKYKGPPHLILEHDMVEQVRKLSWPFRKRRKVIDNDKTPSPISRVNQSKNYSIIFPQGSKSKRSLEYDAASIAQKDCSENEAPKKKMKTGPKSKTRILERTSVPEITLPTDLDIVKVNRKRALVGPKSRKLNLHKLEEQEISKKTYLESKCKFCNIKLESQTPPAFLAHLKAKRCNVMNTYTCSLCREDFSSRKENFKEHQENCNLAQCFSQESKCTKCSGSVSKTLLQNHLSDVHQVLFKCFICSAEFNQKDCLFDHFSKCSFRPSIVKSFTCTTCQRTFENLMSLKKHSLQNHTTIYLNENLSLNYDKLTQWVEIKNSSNILPYERLKYTTCNPKGDFHCNIKNCKKTLNSICELEAHIQEHCKRKKKKGRVKNKRKTAAIQPQTQDTYSQMSICDTYLLKIHLESADVSHSTKETFTINPKDKFLLNLGLQKHSGNEDNPIEVCALLKDLINDSSLQCPQGIFELSDRTGASAYDSLELLKREKSFSPEVLTISSDDDCIGPISPSC